jgi:hypothetical protein
MAEVAPVTLAVIRGRNKKTNAVKVALPLKSKANLFLLSVKITAAMYNGLACQIK